MSVSSVPSPSFSPTYTEIFNVLAQNSFHAAKNYLVGSLLFGNVFHTYHNNYYTPEYTPEKLSTPSFIYKYLFQLPATKLYRLASDTVSTTWDTATLISSANLNQETLISGLNKIQNVAIEAIKWTLNEHGTMMVLSAGTACIVTGLRYYLWPERNSETPTWQLQLRVYSILSIVAFSFTFLVSISDAMYHAEPNYVDRASFTTYHLCVTQAFTSLAFNVFSFSFTRIGKVASKVAQFCDWNAGILVRAKIAKPKEETKEEEGKKSSPASPLQSPAKDKSGPGQAASKKNNSSNKKDK